MNHVGPIALELFVQMLILHNYPVQLLSGGNHDIDIDDLKKNTRYTGGFSEGSRAIKIFWEVLDAEWKLSAGFLIFGFSCSNFLMLPGYLY